MKTSPAWRGRLADALDECKYVDVYRCKQAAAELRRLAKVEDEWAALSQDQGKLESQIDRLVAQRDALLEALKQIEPILARMYGQQAAELPPMRIARAAIAKAVEGEQA